MGSAYITENDNVLDIDPGVKYTINSEDFGEKHDLTILRTYATVNKMGATPPASRIDAPIAVPDNVWPKTQYEICLDSGVQQFYQNILPASLAATADLVLPASVSIAASEQNLRIRQTDANRTLWLAPAGTSQFTESTRMTKATGNSGRIALPSTTGSYKLHVVNGQGQKVGESKAIVRVR